MVLYDVVNDSLIGLDPENGIRELDLADLLTSHIKNFSLHDLLSLSQRFLAEAFCGLVRAEAFCGLMLALAAAPFALKFLTVFLM